MAADDTEDAAIQSCPPCRGTGKVISGLGGSPSTVDCPWCGGSGVLDREADAQARWRQDDPAT